jgi:hypothetical protein
MPKISRRRLLQFAAQAGAVAPATGQGLRPDRVSASTRRQSTDAVGQVLDVAVVGGGVSGAYVAWRLLGPGASQSPVLRRLLAASGAV